MGWVVENGLHHGWGVSANPRHPHVAITRPILVIKGGGEANPKFLLLKDAFYTPKSNAEIKFGG